MQRSGIRGQWSLNRQIPEAAPRALSGQRLLAVFVVDELEEDEAEHGGAVFAGLEVGVGAQCVGGGSAVALQFFELVSAHSVCCLFRP